MQYLFSVAIGPAQEFIAAARRTRDLWFSSCLLSELSKAAANAIGKDHLIFPAITDENDLAPDSEFNVVNKILARIDTDNPQAIGDEVKRVVLARLETIREKALRALPDNAYDPEKAMAQIDDLPEIYWAAVPFPEGKYQEARAQVEALLAARKNTRNFQSAKGWAGNEEKSSLDGWRESVLPNHRRKENETLIQQLEKCGIKKGETLCGVGLLKRFGKPTSQKEDESFASIPHIAAWPLIASLKDANKDANKNDFDEYVEFLRERNIHSTALYRPAHPSSDIFPYDGHILFEEQLKEYFNEETQQSELQQAKVKLSELLKKIGAKPSPYYAILHADGDRMGEAIDAQTTAENHHKLSKALSAFAGEVKTIVSQHHGSLIYAGGDDVLALVPLHTAIQCARKLADTFGESLRAFNAPTLRSALPLHIKWNRSKTSSTWRVKRNARPNNSTAKTRSASRSVSAAVASRR